MAGYIYTQYQGADPSMGWQMNDPIFGKTPTLGACIPNIRKAIKLGDWFFTVTGRTKGSQQFVAGGFRVAEKIDQLAAFGRFPENRVTLSEAGQVIGNVIVSEDGSQNPNDNHTNFERRLDNYLVGDKSVYLDTMPQYEMAKDQTLDRLQDLFGKKGNRVFDILGRGRKMDDDQVTEMRSWLQSIKDNAQ